MRLLLVEDEVDAARMVAKGLREQAFAVDVVHDGLAALEHLHTNSYDLVILDVLLPGRSGLDVCADLRKAGITVPVILLTALDHVNDRIAGLDRGADDYLSKPFHFGELLARIRALLRRGPVLTDSVLKVADLEIDTRSHSVWRGGKPVELTSREYALLEFMARNAGRVIGRAEISEHVWDETYDPFSNLIEVYMQRLRRKIDSGRAVKLLQTRRGEGYQLAAEEHARV
jgi:two-component system copper resistance phosphate regulon response regulator CusR